MKRKGLKEYLARIGMTLKDFCEKIDCDYKQMSKIVNGNINAGHRLAKDVYQETGGKVILETRVRKKDIKKKEDRKKKKKE